jgi:hypothetical protein
MLLGVRPDKGSQTADCTYYIRRCLMALGVLCEATRINAGYKLIWGD